MNSYVFSVFIYNRTDNAVKNRFSTLCKRRAKDDEPFQENGTPCSNTNAKRVLTKTGCVTPGTAGSSLPMKQIRYKNTSSTCMYSKQLNGCMFFFTFSILILLLCLAVPI